MGRVGVRAQAEVVESVVLMAVGLVVLTAVGVMEFLVVMAVGVVDLVVLMAVGVVIVAGVVVVAVSRAVEEFFVVFVVAVANVALLGV